MTDSSSPVPADPPPAAAPAPPPPEEKPRSRGWFVGLASLTLVLFGLFILGITLAAATIPQIRKARLEQRR